MFNFKHKMVTLLLAVCCLGGGQASAGAVYRVDIDSTTLGSGNAYLGLYFLGLGNAAESSATVSQLLGELSGTAQFSGTVSGGAPGPLVFGSANGGGDWVQGVNLGGKFSFMVDFLSAEGDAGMAFGWALFNDAGYLGLDGDLGTILLQPGTSSDAVFLVSDANRFSAAARVPEPSSILLLLVGCVALSGVARLRASR